VDARGDREPQQLVTGWLSPCVRGLVS